MEFGLPLEDILQKLAEEGYRISRRTFLYYVQLGLLPKGKRKGQKSGGVKFYYPTWTLERLKTILRLKKQGLTLKEIKKRLPRETPSPPPPKTFPQTARLKDCNVCGICGAICPVHEEMDLSPWRLIQAWLEGPDSLPSANTPWVCVGCYLCEERCPREIPVVDFLRFLRREGLPPGKRWRKHPEWSRIFWSLLEERGRSFDFGAVHAYHIRIIGSGENQRLFLRLPGPEGEKEVSAPSKIKNLSAFRRALEHAREWP